MKQPQKTNVDVFYINEQTRRFNHCSNGITLESLTLSIFNQRLAIQTSTHNYGYIYYYKRIVRFTLVEFR
jgi:hypothetical protein